MKNNIRWPIYIDDKSSLFIKHRGSWLTYKGNGSYMRVLLYTISIIIIIYWLLSIYNNLDHSNDLDIIFNVDRHYIFNYTFEYFKDITSYREFYFKIDFKDIYYNLFIYDPLNYLMGLINLYIFLDPTSLNQAHDNLIMDSLAFQYPYKWWSYHNPWHILYDISYYQIKIFESRYWMRYGSRIWNLNPNLFIHKHVKVILPRIIHVAAYGVIRADYPATRIVTYRYAGLHIFYLMLAMGYTYFYICDPNVFLVFDTDFAMVIGWGYKWGLFDLTRVVKYVNNNSLVLNYYYEKFFSSTKNAYSLHHLASNPFITHDYFKEINWLFFPHVSTFILKYIYLPIYLPLDSFNQGLIYRYNNVISTFFWFIEFLFYTKLLVNFKLWYMVNIYSEHYTFLLISKSLFGYLYDFCTGSMYTLNLYFNEYVTEIFNIGSFFTQIKNIILKPFVHWTCSIYGFTSITKMRDIIAFFIAYFILMKGLIKLLWSNRDQDLWLYTVIWYSPTYAWNVYQLNYILENDYMSSVDHYKRMRMQNYMYLLYRFLRPFYFIVLPTALHYVLKALEASLGFAYYFAYPNITESNILLCTWIYYVIVPLVIYFIWVIFNSILAGFRTFTDNLLLNNNYALIICYLYYVLVMNVNNKSFFSIQKKIYYSHSSNDSIQRNIDIFGNYSINKLNSKLDINKYWYYTEKSSFDWVTTRNYRYNKVNNNTFKPSPKYYNNLLASYDYMKYQNVTWLAIRTNHFYQYYDYIDEALLSSSWKSF